MATRLFAATLLASTAVHISNVQAQTADQQSAATSQTPTSSDATNAGAVPPTNNGDIVVTALKRGTTASRTPASVTILPAAELTQRNITTLNQLNGIVPGLVLANATDRPGVSFRGLGSSTAIFNLEPSVGQYQDGVYQSHGRDYVSPVFDVDHVEFIKGTQSSVLGKNNSLGAISIVNRRPGDHFSYDVNVSHSEGVQTNKIESGITIPLSNALSVRLAGLALQDEGYLRNVYLDRNDGRDREIGGRIMLSFKPTDELDAFFSYQHNARQVRGQSLQVVSDPSGVIAARSAAAGAPFAAGSADLAAAAQRALIGTTASKEPYDNQDTNRLNLILTAKLGTVTLTSQTAYVSWKSPRATDLDFTPAALFGYTELEQSRSVTQEFRASTDLSDRAHVLVGLFYYGNDWALDRTLLGSSNNVGFPATGIADSMTNVSTSSIAVFGSQTFDITSRLMLDAGIRYTHERKTGDFVRASSGALRGTYPTVPFGQFSPEVSDPLDYSVGVRFQATPHVLAYATYAVATKSGAFQDTPSTLAGAPFAPETARSVEFGLKAQFLHGSITGAFYDTRIKDFQTVYTGTIGSPPVAQALVGNAQVRTTGFEAMANYDLTPELRVGAQVVYANARFTQDFSTLTRAGDRVTRAPEWTEQISAEYHAPVSDSITIFAGGTVDFTSPTLYQFAFSQPTAPSSPSHQLINARLGFRGRNDAWQVALVSTNLADQRYVAYSSGITSAGGAYYGRYNQPRTVGLQLTLKR